MAENRATLDDVKMFFPDLAPPAQEAQAERLLQVAWVRLLAIPGLRIARRIDDGSLPQEVVSSVQGEMVANVLKNPDARTRNLSMAIDDYSESEQLTIDSARAEGVLLPPTDAMLSLLRRSGRGAWTVIPS